MSVKATSFKTHILKKVNECLSFGQKFCYKIIIAIHHIVVQHLKETQNSVITGIVITGSWASTACRPRSDGGSTSRRK